MPVRTLVQRRYWAVHAFALACLGAACALGVWQLGSWQEQREAAARDLTTGEAVPLTDVMGPDDRFPGADLGRPVTVEGTWVPSGTVYVANRHDGDDGDDDGQDMGYWVVTPLAVPAGDDPAMLVVRGWVADPDDAPAAPDGEGSVTGWLQPGEGTGEVDEDPTDDVIPQLRLGNALQHVDQDLYGAYVVMDPERPHTNVADDTLRPASLDALPESGRFTALRNFLYAIQWWVFGAFVVVVWWRHCRDLLEAEDAADSDGDPEGGSDGPAGAGAADPESRADHDDDVPSTP